MSNTARLSPALALLWSCQSVAHSPIAGISDFYGAMLHPLFVPAQTLALILFALLLGRQGFAAMRQAYGAFAAILAASLLSTLLITETDPARAPWIQQGLLGTALVSGLLLAAARSLPTYIWPLAAGLLALLLGLDFREEQAQAQSPVLTSLGSWLGACIVLVVGAGLSECLRSHWHQIALRIMGSWGSASALLVLALASVA